MNQHVLPVFDEFCDQLLPLGAITSPSELHGLLCGKLCGGERMPLGIWESTAWEFLDVVGDPGDVISSMVTSLYSVTLQQLNSDNFDLQLLLPDDDVELGQRLQALGQWCHGFLSGIGSAGIAGESELSADAADSLRDFAAIVQIGVDDDCEEQQAEGDFVEVSEYVKVAALNLYMEFGIKSDGEPPTQLH